MTPLTITLAAGVGKSFDIGGDWFHVQTAPVDDLVVRFDDGEPVKLSQGMGLRRYYQRVELESATGQAVRVLVGFGSVTDGRASVTGLTLNTTIAPGNTFDDGGRVSCVHAARTQLLAADADRLYALIKNPSTNTLTMFVGTVGVTAASGVPVEPGETLPVATTAALYAWNADAALDEYLWASSVKEV
jgi:hypothetical protein